MRRPRVGFLGVGWIGRHRMEAMLATGAVEAAAIVDPSPDCAAEAARLAPRAALPGSYEEMLALGLDGVAIATPSALHAEQSAAALEAGAAVFCQKPLGRTAAEVREVVEAARKADRLLAVDLSYRFTEGVQRIRELIREGELGRVFAADLVFHNAYGPDKGWFYDPARSGGGCVIDLGVHLVDLALWALDFPAVAGVSARLLAGGAALAEPAGQVEDYAVATLDLAGGAVIRLACSWRLQAGCDARIAAEFHGTAGGAALRNLGGSFYDFAAERYRGTQCETLASPPDAWGGRAAADWARRLAGGERFAGEAERLVDVADVLDRIYGR
ncbi:MAG TPA: Gfo/Idh/MocA family oxidoreductase [Allosphingosinicella sp.]|nr:Gfo/Idh/MocA family oxidoreductase [Allosphingosinicella sp.]